VKVIIVDTIKITAATLNKNGDSFIFYTFQTRRKIEIIKPTRRFIALSAIQIDYESLIV